MKKMIGRGLIHFLAVAAVASLACCKGSHGSSHVDDTGEDVEMKYASNIRITVHGGYHEVTVRNPWDTVRTLQKYFLVPRDSAMPEDQPEGTLVRIPVRNALVYSTVHTGLLDELGAVSAIGGICNSEYIKSQNIRRRIAAGAVADCGNSMAPDMEKILQLRPDVIMLSPFENNDKYSKVGEIGIPIIECADYMETSPLGRAEWVKFYGLLTGTEEAAESMFEEVEKNYLSMKGLASKATRMQKVLLDQRYGQVWNVPAGMSTTGILIQDAGGVNPFAEIRQSGSVPLAPEKVLSMAHDADVWLVRFNQTTDKSLKELADDSPVNCEFKAFKEGNVYGCNTRYSNYFEETPFHPDRILHDYIRILHPELTGDRTLHYFHRLK